MSAKVIPFEPRTRKQTDEALIARCVMRDQSALSELFARHHAPVYRFLGRLVGYRNPEVDDLVQSTFLEAWTCAAKFKGQSSVRAWLLGIAANLARRHFRKRSRKENALALLKVSGGEPGVSVDEIVAKRQLVERLAAALEKLPHNLRVAYVLCELEEIPGTEAARALGVRPGTMWRRLHQARKKLKTLIEREVATS